MAISKLTKKEKLVFYSLIKNPDLNDNEMSKKISVKRSTITAIRNRLRRDNFYHTIVLPNLKLLGCTIVSIIYGKYNPLTPRTVRKQAETFDEKLKQPELVFARSTDTEFIALYFSKTLLDMRRMQDKTILDYESHEFLEDVKRIYYPIELCEILSFFNYTEILAHLFDIKDAENKYTPIWTEPNKIQLTKTEKTILSALVKWPDATNIEIAKKTGKTRATISKVKKKLLENGVIKIVNIPEVEKLGCELLVFMHEMFNPKCTREVRKDGIDLMLKTARPYFKVSGDIESASLIIPQNYTEYMSIYNQIIGFYKEKRYITENPYVLIFPIKQLKLKKLDFSPIVDKLLFEKE